MTVTRRSEGIYGYVVIEAAPSNRFDAEIRQGLLSAAEWAEAEGLERVIVSGALAAAPAAPEGGPSLQEALSRIETSVVPWIAVLEGDATGAGADLVLACQYRVAAPGATIAFPEAAAGALPCGGATQRLPRLVGLERALAMIAGGEAVGAADAKAMGLVDEIDAEALSFAEMTNGEWLGMAVPVWELNTGDVDEAAFDAARAKAAGNAAALKAIDLLSLARTAPFADGLAAEAEAAAALSAAQAAGA
ncbi:enoyl-CoA hydratase/isomerase family protein [Rhodovulum sp. DZ06]|uniref:enoyl-CoA hydratase/isomerase family protein n=1 Tax=Rhodovulum sp. DZ06 TaxID=3425126 RepID=UPI003D33087A